MAIQSCNIVVNLIKYFYNNQLVDNYAQSVVRELRELGHNVTETGPGTAYENNIDYSKWDLFIDLDCGRNPITNELNFKFIEEKSNVPSVVWFIDSHGYPSMHHRIAKNYDHVFFAVWSKRDLFANHRSAYWCPNATDKNWFNSSFVNFDPYFDFGFFGSKKGLSRAEAMRLICGQQGWTYDIRQISPPNKHRWPHTAKAMGNCRILFNHGQKHDSPNLRVVESMAMGIPLISDQDPLSGMDKLFTPFSHYFPYEYVTYSNLDYIMKFVSSNYQKALEVAAEAQKEVYEKHLIKHRVKQMLEVALENK